MTADLLTFQPSSAQQRLWFLAQLTPGDVAYNMALARRIRGPLDVGALEKAIAAIVERHEVLRTTFRAAAGKPVQVVGPAGEIRLPVSDLSTLPDEARERELESRGQAEVQRPFDLRSGPLFRSVLYRLSQDHHVLLLVMHHIASDGWSMGVLTRELGALYGDFVSGRAPSLPELPIQYADYAEWQREWLQGDLLNEALGYWRSQLAGAPQVLELPTDRPRPAVESHRGANHTFTISRELHEGLGVLARREGATLFMVLLAAFDVLLWRYTGQEDLIVGTPVANRSRTELEGLIGLFVNTLVLRSDVSGDPTIRELLGRVRESCLDAYAHQDLPFERLVEELRPERDLSRNPLFQVMLVIQGATPPLDLPGLTTSQAILARPTAQLDLTLHFQGTPEGLRGIFEYPTDLFDRETIARLAGHLSTILRAMQEQPARPISELPLLSEGERAQIAHGWNQTQREYPRACVHELISAQAQSRPEQVAVSFEDRTLSYAELERRSSHLSRRLRAQGVGPGVRVGIFMERSAEMLVGVLGVWKAGAAYVPLDPAFPAERVSYMLEDSGAALLLSHAALKDELPSHSVPVLLVDDEDQELPASVEREEGRARPEDLAYLIYTSGSTGRPKGVAVTHASLVNLLESMGREPGFVEKDVLLSVTTLSFDIAALELYLPLLKGGQIVLVSRDEALDGRQLMERLASSGTTVMQATPATWRLLLESGWQGTPGLKVLCGGEALSRDLANELLKRAGVVWNVYGPTETTVWSSAGRVTPGDGAISIGRPIANTQMWVLDARLEPLPVGVPGELYIGGAGVAQGYWERPELTAERFAPDPFSEVSGARLYRTGDLARWLPDGRIECLGRIDQQVKVRGFRIELGEIEAALREWPGVEDAAVLAQEAAGGDRRLAAFLTQGATATVNVTQLRAHLKTRLPAYMVPSSFVFLEQLPLTPNGKLDRKALAKVNAEGDPSRPEPTAPRTATEEILAGIWAEVLRIERVGVEDDFFDLGGHSLLATQVVSRVRQKLRVELPLRELFATPTVARLAAYIEEARAAPASGLTGPSLAPAPLLAPEPTRQLVDLSFAQQRLWFLHQVEGSSQAYVISVALRLRGPLAVAALETALGAIVARHESLRTTFASVEGRAVQIVADPGPLALKLTDLSGESDRLGARLAEEAAAGFDLEIGPLFRPVLFQLGPEEHVLLLLQHHIVSDAWSLDVLLRELGALYADHLGGRPPSLAALPVQYRDFSRWQREALRGDRLEQELGYWRSRLAGAPQVLELPTDRPRPVVESHRGAESLVTFSRELSEELGALARREGTTLFMLLLAAFDVLLWRYTGQENLLVGTPVANRSRTELEGLIGLFVNTLVLRSDVSGDPTVRELLARVREKCLDAYAHQDLPFERLVEELRPERDLSRNPLFQVMLVLQNAGSRPLELPGLEVSWVGVKRRAAQLDLSLYVRETAEGLRGAFEYATDLFDAETIVRMGGHLNSILEGFVAGTTRRLSELPLLTASERLVQQEWNATPAPFSGACVHDLISQQAESRPEQVAVSFEDRTLSYSQLERRSSHLSRRLRAQGVGPGVRVGIFMERSPEMLVGVLGVWKAGAAYVPLDPAFPAERVSYMLEDSGAALLLSHAALKDELPSHSVPVLLVDDEDQELPASVEREEGRARPEDLAYLIYTSGSTGRPKGVAVTHASLVNLLESMGREPGLVEKDVLLSVTTLSFDIAALELYLPLLKGGQIVLVSRDEALDGRQLMERLASSGTTVMQATPATWRLLLESGWQGTPGLKVLCGGEALSRDLANELLKRAGVVWNVYGPTETTVWSSAGRVTPGDGAISIGRPIANTQMWVLDARLEPLPVGVPGELYIGGAGVAQGYWQRPELTAERFVPDPFSEVSGARLYRTGDLARWLPDGRIECLGRIDQQVKVRGFRIELGEIEAALREWPGVEDAAVLAQEAAGGDRRLAAFLTQGATEAVNVTQLRAHLKTRLPAYMVPSSFVFLEQLPLTPNGKLDRKALAKVNAGADARRLEHLPPRTPAEALIADIWKEALGVAAVSVHDNFFDLGGHSLLAMRVLAAIEKRTGRRFHPRDIIFQTLEQLAANLPAISEGDAPLPPARSLAGRVLEAAKGLVSGRRPDR